MAVSNGWEGESRGLEPLIPFASKLWIINSLFLFPHIFSPKWSCSRTISFRCYWHSSFYSNVNRYKLFGGQFFIKWKSTVDSAAATALNNVHSIKFTKQLLAIHMCMQEIFMRNLPFIHAHRSGILKTMFDNWHSLSRNKAAASVDKRIISVYCFFFRFCCLSTLIFV